MYVYVYVYIVLHIIILYSYCTVHVMYFIVPGLDNLIPDSMYNNLCTLILGRLQHTIVLITDLGSSCKEKWFQRELCCHQGTEEGCCS